MDMDTSKTIVWGIWMPLEMSGSKPVVVLKLHRMEAKHLCQKKN